MQQIPGWDVVENDGVLTATRREKSSEYARMYGAVDVLDARNDDELVVLAHAQTVLVRELAKAEGVYRADRARRAAAANNLRRSSLA